MAYFGIRINGVASCLSTKNLEGSYAVRGTMAAKPSEGSLYLTEEHLPLEMHPITYKELETVKEYKVSEPQDIAESVCWL